jgi:hypothetical protein
MIPPVAVINPTTWAPLDKVRRPPSRIKTSEKLSVVLPEILRPEKRGPERDDILRLLFDPACLRLRIASRLLLDINVL